MQGQCRPDSFPRLKPHFRFHIVGQAKDIRDEHDRLFAQRGDDARMQHAFVQAIVNILRFGQQLLDPL
jgi:hypothetical protein